MNSDISLGAVTIALISGAFGLIWKIWRDTMSVQKDISEKVLSVVERAAVNQEKLARNVDSNTRAIQIQTQVLSKQDTTLSLIIESMHPSHDSSTRKRSKKL